MDKTVLIDADAIVYSAGWAGCRRYYVYRGKEYQYKKELPPGYDEDDLHLVVEPEELRNTYSNVRKAMDSILEALAPVNTFKADRKSTRLNSSHRTLSRMPSSA